MSHNQPPMTSTLTMPRSIIGSPIREHETLAITESNQPEPATQDGYFTNAEVNHVLAGLGVGEGEGVA